jgi:hypothetical protein
LPFHSQFGEDEWLFSNLFYNKINGFYLEMGAMDGTTYSNTRWLQQAAGWKGMLIEACPGGVAAASVAARQMDRRDKCMPSVPLGSDCLVRAAAPLDHPELPPHLWVSARVLQPWLPKCLNPGKIQSASMPPSAGSSEPCIGTALTA